MLVDLKKHSSDAFGRAGQTASALCELTEEEGGPNGDKATNIKTTVARIQVMAQAQATWAHTQL